MAELVDARGSGPSGSNLVQVRVLFWASKAGDWRKYAIFTSPPAFSVHIALGIFGGEVL